MAIKRFKSNKRLITQLFERLMGSPCRSDLYVGDKSKPEEKIYRFHLNGKVEAVLRDLLEPFENDEFVDAFIPTGEDDHDELHLAIHIEEETVYEVMVWDYVKDRRIRNVCVHVDGEPKKQPLQYFVPSKGE